MAHVFGKVDNGDLSDGSVTKPIERGEEQTAGDPGGSASGVH